MTSQVWKGMPDTSNWMMTASLNRKILSQCVMTLDSLQSFVSVADLERISDGFQEIYAVPRLQDA
jgi:hypothetical protein